jgi:uncharacterized membrane protein
MYAAHVTGTISSESTVALAEHEHGDRMRGRAYVLLAWTIPVLVGLILRIPHLTESLWFDEVWRTDAVLRGGKLSRILLHDVHNPLYNLVMYAWTAVAGDSEIAIRLPSLLFAAVAMWVLARWVGPRFGNLAAWLVTTLLLLSPVHAWYSCEAKNNMLVFMLAVLTVLRADSMLHTPTTRNALLTALFAVLGVGTSWQAFLLLLPMWLGLIVLAGHPSLASRDQHLYTTTTRRRAVLASILITFAVLSPLLIFKALHAAELARDYVVALDFHHAVRLLLIWYPTGNALLRLRDNTFLLTAAAYGVLVIPPFIAGVRAMWQTASGRLAIVCAVGPIAILLASTLLFTAAGQDPPRIYQDRNTLVAMPWLFAIVAVGAVNLTRLRVLFISLLIMLSLASSIAAVTWRYDKPTVMNPNPDWRQAAAFIRDSLTSTRPPIIVSTCPLLPLDYYLPEATHAEITWNADIAVLIEKYRIANPENDVYFINNPHWFGHPADQLRSLEARLNPAQTLHVRSLQIYRLRRPQEARTPR